MPKKTKKPAKKPTRKIVKRPKRSVFGLKLHHASFLALCLLAIGWGLIIASGQTPKKSSADGCVVSLILVNSCRPWLGAASDNYPSPYASGSDTKSQILGHEARIGRQLDIVHTYHPVGNNSLSSTDLYFATRANTYLFANWKPAAHWADAGGGTSTAEQAVNAGIDKMAKSIGAIAPKQIFLSVHHEPENDTSSGGTCKSYKGSSGSAAQYKAMWSNVEDRFKNVDHVTNVVWVMDYMNYPPWLCVVDQLYPGDNLVDWVMFNGYGNGSDSWTNQVGPFYNKMSTDHPGKPLGIVEWAYAGGNNYSGYFDQVRAALDNNTYPLLRAYMVYDSRDQGSDTGSNRRVAYTDAGAYSQNQMDHYIGLANDPHLIDGGVVTSVPIGVLGGTGSSGPIGNPCAALGITCDSATICNTGQSGTAETPCVALPPASTRDSASTNNCTADCGLVAKYAIPFINFLAAMVGVVVTISIVIGGIQYTTSRDNP
ncbi:MAG TPA: glycosyl hydrolase, partial [Patescibacteria group bacterium]|nr:glycosyl hydrolase [Patescibacteria group bacterium]